MPDPVTAIPDRAAFKAAEVCEIAQIPPYVLRSWEKEFPGLGVAGKPGGPKIYRRSDVEQVLRIKQLLFSEGLTLAGARRKLEGEPPPEPDAEPALPVPEDVRAKVGTVKRELRSLLEMLSDGPGEGGRRPKAAEAAALSAEAPGGAVAPAAEAHGEPAAPPARPAGTWPPAPARKAEEAGGDPGLPLLDGTADQPEAPAPEPSRPRRPRRGAKG